MKSPRKTSPPRLIDERTGAELKDFIFNWRDPEMPVMEPATCSLTGEKVTLVKLPIERQLDCQHRLSLGSRGVEPSWRDDPTYNMRKKK
jgi:hypothetical protein